MFGKSERRKYAWREKKCSARKNGVNGQGEKKMFGKRERRKYARREK